jgi:hypothetical protein
LLIPESLKLFLISTQASWWAASAMTEENLE